MPEKACNFNMLRPWEYVTQGGGACLKTSSYYLDRIYRIMSIFYWHRPAPQPDFPILFRRKADWVFLSFFRKLRNPTIK